MRIEPGRIAVVTGGASGIGFALAAAAAARGQDVVLADIAPDALAAATGRLRAAGATVTPVPADVSRAADIEELARTAFALGPVQLVCSNAGIVTFGRAWERSAADWDKMMSVNFMATVHLARAFLPRLIEAGDPAALLVTGSMASVTARAGISPYIAAKHALLGLCETLGAELADAHAPVGVTLLMPGRVATGMSREDHPDAITPDEAARIAFAAVTAGRRSRSPTPTGSPRSSAGSRPSSPTAGPPPTVLMTLDDAGGTMGTQPGVARRAVAERDPPRAGSGPESGAVRVDQRRGRRGNLWLNERGLHHHSPSGAVPGAGVISGPPRRSGRRRTVPPRR